jgi:NADH dehydrogenase (ubiquinone) 1 alpha subcomplex subunit 2
MSWKARISRNLEEIRVIFCPTSKASLPTRFYFEKNFNELIQLNPGFPLAIRESEDTEPVIWGAYSNNNNQ